MPTNKRWRIEWDEGHQDADGYREPDRISINNIFNIEWQPETPEAHFWDAEYYGSAWLNKEDIYEIINVLERLANRMPDNY